MPFPSADSLMEVPIEHIIKFRELYSDERRNLREALEEMMKSVPTIDDENHLRDHVHDKQGRLNDAIKAQRGALERFYVQGVPSVLQISVPTGPLALAAVMGAPPVTLAVLGVGAVA